MKIVFDTNVILSALITQGLSSRVMDICIDSHQIFISSWIINEVLEKLLSKFRVKVSELKRVKDFLLNVSHQITPIGRIPTVCDDKDDNNILHLSEFVDADLIITGDKDLLVLKKYSNTKIIDPRMFMEEFYY